MKKTALTILIEKLRVDLDLTDGLKGFEFGHNQGLLMAIEQAISLLQKEREDIEKAISIGLNYKSVGYYPNLSDAFKDNFEQYTPQP